MISGQGSFTSVPLRFSDTYVFLPHTHAQGLLRVIESASAPPLLDIDQLLRPQKVVVRVYVLGAFALQPDGSKHGCDPYIKVKLGRNTISWVLVFQCVLLCSTGVFL